MLYAFILALFIILPFGANADEIFVHQDEQTLSYTLNSLNSPEHSEFFTSPRDDYTKGLSIEISFEHRNVLNRDGDSFTLLGRDDAYLTIFDETTINPGVKITRSIDANQIVSQIKKYYPSLDKYKTYTVRQTVVFLKISDGKTSPDFVKVSGYCLYRPIESKLHCYP